MYSSLAVDGILISECEKLAGMFLFLLVLSATLSATYSQLPGPSGRSGPPGQPGQPGQPAPPRLGICLYSRPCDIPLIPEK